MTKKAYCTALTKRVIKREIRLDGKLSKKLGLRNGNVGRANWEDERNNHIRHSACLSKIESYLNGKYMIITFLKLTANFEKAKKIAQKKIQTQKIAQKHVAYNIS